MSLKKPALVLLVALTVLGGILTGCNSTVTAAPGTTVTAKTWYQQIADAVKEMQPTDAPQTLWPADGVRSSTDFNVNEYFTALTHLSMQEGYVLDYVYLSDGTSGGPILYVRPDNATPFANYTEYKDATHQTPRQTDDKELIWMVEGATGSSLGNRINIDGTNEGYFEYGVLQIIGNKFYLHGYPSISNTSIVCESSAVENIISQLRASTNDTLDSAFIKSARGLNVTPKITSDENTVSVSMVTFSVLSGFMRVTLKIQKTYPNIITDETDQSLLEYKSTQG